MKNLAIALLIVANLCLGVAMLVLTIDHIELKRKVSNIEKLIEIESK